MSLLLRQPNIYPGAPSTWEGTAQMLGTKRTVGTRNPDIFLTNTANTHADNDKK